MTITIELSNEQGLTVEAEASRRGQQPAEFVRGLVVRGLTPKPTLAEILAPLRQQVEESGVSDDELDALFRSAREEVYQGSLRDSGK